MTNEVSKLHFTNAVADRFDYNVSLPAKLDRLIEKLEFSRHFDKDEPVAIKMHLGNPGTHRTIHPLFVKQVVDALKAIGTVPFVSDSVRIPGLKYLETARMNGYNELTLGCPVVMADGIFGHDAVEVKAGRHLKTAMIPSVFYDVKNMVVLTHATGHAAYGFGGAMKNIAMGLIGHHCRSDSWEKGGRGLMHMMGKKTFDVLPENCVLCEACINICPLDAINFSDNHIDIDWKKCWRCLRCTRVCEHGALVQPEVTDDFYEALAEGAQAAMNTFEKDKVVHISFLMNLQPECDCMPMSGIPLVSDIGILGGTDMIAIDWATLDLVGDMPPNAGSQAEGMTSSRDNDVFSQVNSREPRKYLEFAEKLGLGTRNYELIKI